MTTELSTLAVGMTCTFGAGKTIWEIVRIDHDSNGAPKQLHLSKAGGDGYVNRWATPAEIRNLTAQALQVTLGSVLDHREASATAAHNLELSIKLKTKPAELANIIKRATAAAETYASLYAQHLDETAAAT